MGKIYENKELWKQISTAILKKMREDGKINWTDEEIDKKVDAMINDTKRTERHILAVQIKEKTSKQEKIYAKLTEEYKAAHGGVIDKHGFNAYIHGYLDTSDTPEAAEKNKKIVEQTLDNKQSRKLLGEYTKNCFNADMSKFYTDDLNEIFKLYRDHTGEVLGMFTIDRVFSTMGNYTQSPEFKKYYSVAKTFIEGGGFAKAAVDYYSNPAMLLVPDEIDSMIVFEEMPKISKVVSGMLVGQNLDGFEMDGGNGRCRNLGSLGGYKLPFTQAYNEAVPLIKLFKDGTVPTNLAYEYKVLKDGKEVPNLSDALNAMTKGEKYDIVKRTPEELKQLDHAINYAVEDKAAAQEYMNNKKAALTNLRNELKNAKHWYQLSSYNHKEYNDLMNKLNSTLSDDGNWSWTRHKDMLQSFADIKKLSNAYLEKNHGSDNKIRLKRMEICAKINGLCNSAEAEKDITFFTPLDGVEPAVEAPVQEVPNAIPEKVAIEVNLNEKENVKDTEIENEDALENDLDKSFIDESTVEKDDDILGLK